MTYELLEKAPKDHLSDEFLEFLRKNNKVVWEDEYWLIIENCKYHSKEKPWLTAFSKNEVVPFHALSIFFRKYADWEWLKKAANKQTVKRFHIHLIRK